MTDEQIAPYPFTVGQDAIPTGAPLTGVFPVMLCTTAERLQEILNALKIAEIYAGLNIDSKVDILEALAFLDNPQDSPCYPDCNSEEDTLTDDIFDFIDGIVTSVQSGGIVEAIGYVIEEYGEIIVQTGLKIIGITVLGYLTGGIVSILFDGVLADTVTIGIGEIVDTVISIPDNVIDIKFIYDAVA